MHYWQNGQMWWNLHFTKMICNSFTQRLSNVLNLDDFIASIKKRAMSDYCLNSWREMTRNLPSKGLPIDKPSPWRPALLSIWPSMLYISRASTTSFVLHTIASIVSNPKYSDNSLDTNLEGSYMLNWKKMDGTLDTQYNNNNYNHHCHHHHHHWEPVNLIQKESKYNQEKKERNTLYNYEYYPTQLQIRMISGS